MTTVAAIEQDDIRSRPFPPVRTVDMRRVLYFLPVVMLLGLFTYWPLIHTVYLSFVRLNFNDGPDRFVGFANYTGLFQSVQFGDAAINTILYLLLALPLKVLLPIPLAIFIWGMGRCAGDIYKSALIVPTLLSFVVVAISWIWLLNPVAGMFQQIVANFGVQMPSLLSDSHTALVTITAIGAWKVMGFNTLFYLAGLASINRDYVEAMRLDGASEWRLCRHLVWPLLAPTTVFVTISTVIFTVQQLFTPIDIMTQGGPSNATTNLFYLVYQYAFGAFNIGYASAGTIILFLFLGLIAGVKFLLLDRWAHYQ